MSLRLFIEGVDNGYLIETSMLNGGKFDIQVKLVARDTNEMLHELCVLLDYDPEDFCEYCEMLRLARGEK